MKEELYIQIQQYLDNSMPQNERKAFEVSLKQNPELKKEFDLIAGIEEELGNQKISDFNNQLEEILAAPIEEKPAGKSVNFGRRLIGIVASLFLIGGALWWFVGNNQNDDLIAIADEYFLHYPADDVIRGDSAAEKIYESYNQKNYKSAAQELKEEGDKTKDSQKWLFSAISYLAIGNPEECINLVSKIEDSPALNNKKFYFEGLAYLKKGDKTMALKALQKINMGDQFIYNKTQQIIAKLE